MICPLASCPEDDFTVRRALSGNKRRLSAAWSGVLLAIAVASVSSVARAQSLSDEDLYSANEMGGVGLLQTRTARFAPDGALELGVSFLNPYRRYYVTWQILPWLEASFRYTDTTNRLVGAVVVSQSQRDFYNNIINLRGGGTNLDRGFDFKVKLWGEGDIRPAMAIGVQDALGTGLFGGEYFVASKRFRRFDLHLGMGWGYLGSRGFLPNPFRILGGGFDDRDAEVGRGGKVSLGNYFGGRRVALFGGVEYHTPIEGLSLKVEYSGNDPALEPGQNPLNEDLPLGIGVNYRPTSWFDLSLGWERGNSLMIRTAVRTNLFSSGIPKNDPPQPRLNPRPPQGDIDIVRDSIDLNNSGKADLNALYRDLEAMGLRVASLRIDLREATLRASPVDAAVNVAANGDNWRAGAAGVMLRYLSINVRRVMVHGLGDGSADNALILSRTAAEFSANLEKIDSTESIGLLTQVSLSGRNLSLQLEDNAPGRAFADADDSGLIEYATADVQSVSVVRGGSVIAYSDVLARRVEAEVAAAFGALEQGAVEAREVRVSSRGVQVYEASDGAATSAGQADESGRSLPALRNMADVSRVERASLLQEGGAGPLDTSSLARLIFRDLTKAGYTGYAFELEGAEATIHVSKTRYLQLPRNIGWVSRIAANHLPANVEWITVVQMEEGVEISRVSILRTDLERYDAGRGSPEEIWQHVRIENPGSPGLGLSLPESAVVSADAFPETNWWIKPKLLQHIGDPDTGLYLADVYASAGASVSPLPGLTLRGEVRQFVFGSLDKIRRGSESVLPHVRSDIASYLKEGRTAIAQLQADYVTSLGTDLYFRASAGLFESMFGGVGAELLYRPVESRWAMGVDINWVKQRDFDQLLSFRDYDVVTGHASLYYDWPVYDLRSIVRVGRYLAGDLGTTIDISRRFKSGVRVGAFATFTEVSAVDFGEGSFDKGFYVSIPLESLLPVSMRGQSSIMFRPLARDGGQMLNMGPRLYEVVENSDFYALRRDWNRIFD